MSGRSFGRVIRLGAINFWRNRWLSLASVMVVGITLFIIGVFFIQGIVIQNTTQAIKDKLDLSIYFNDDVSEESIKQIQSSLANRPDIKSVEYVSKEKAFEIFQSRPSSEKIKSLITPEDNPLPRSLVIVPVDPKDLEQLAKIFEADRYESSVRRISYQDNKNVIESLVEASVTVKQNGWILTIVAIFLSFVLIYNTTRIIIVSRSDEIEIMRLVGSTESFVRAPFLVEASLYGILGAVSAIGALYLFLQYDLASATPLLSIANFLAPDMLSFFIENLLMIAGVLILAGVLIATIMSSFAVRRFVKM